MRVLIADDNRDAVESLVLLSGAWGFEPVAAYDGISALEILRQPDSPLLCILDWNMPEMTGIQICREIRQEVELPYRYVILITGRGDGSDMVMGLSAGADDFLFKPVKADELRARLVTGRRVLSLQDQLLRSMKQLKEQAARDGLTGLWNRAAIFEILERELTRGDRQTTSLAVILADIDHFKDINDTRGHLIGDLVLHQIGQRLTGSVRPYDSVGRYGGEEFLIVLPGCHFAEAVALAERLRRAVSDPGVVVPGGTVQTSASFGVTTWDGRMSVAKLVQQADEYLYRAKNEGRNRVVGAASESD